MKKLDNRLENLALCPNKSVHQKAHYSLEQIGMDFVRAGFVEYDLKSHTYVAHNKLRELLEHPEEGNQQPSGESDLPEGSTTSSNSVSDTMKDHERGALRLELRGPGTPYGPFSGVDIRELILSDDIV
jgi:hypothetical protein